ncbi:type IV secretory system conjugative DNA transfer family protein [Candidatus Jorgensenbacteria bacterium]|nr:type IV secretory system conjugative DNA transfer family protein [Candidatus Jorgensenbacteria bacterium]
MFAAIITGLVLCIIFGSVVIYFFSRRARHQKFLEELDLKLFLVRLPIVDSEGKDLKQEIGISEQLVTSLASFRKPFIFEVAVHYIGEEIHFYVAVPASLSEPLTRQIQSLWSNAEVNLAPDYNVFNYSGSTSAVWVRQKERFILPIRTYAELNNDTFSPIIGGLAKISQIGEGCAIQMIVRPALNNSKREVMGAFQVLKKGWKLKDVLARPHSFSLGEVREALAPDKKKSDMEAKIVDEAAVRALEMKAAKPLFEINMRIVASAPTQVQSDAILQGVTAGFAQFGAPYRNELQVVRPREPRGLIHEFSFREFNENERMTMTSEELTSLFHFPTAFTTTPRVKYLKAKEAPPPSELAGGGVLLGQSVFRGEVKDIRLSDDDRRRHLYIIGQTGTGKSTLLTNMVSEDIRLGKGVAIVDPHGDLIDSVLGSIPRERERDVIVFDPSDLTRPLGLNMLEYDVSRPEQKTFIVNEMVGIFDKLYDLKVTGGPMFEQYMRNALLLLMEDAPNEPATLMEVARIFTDAAFRNRKIERIKNPTVIDFWEKEATKAGGEAALSNMTPYITSKFNTFTANDYMRVIIGQTNSAFNFREVMDSGRILLVNLSKGRIGDINANLLGMIIVGKILMAALGRVDMPEAERRDFYLYIDEFQNFTTDSIASILSEARKYRLTLTIAHQFIAQLTEKIKDAVFGNVGSTVAFRVGAQDGEALVKQFEPTFNVQDLMNIDNYNAYVKLLVHGQTTKPFNIKTIKPTSPNLDVAKALKESSRSRYGVSRDQVEAEIYRRLRE